MNTFNGQKRSASSSGNGVSLWRWVSGGLFTLAIVLGTALASTTSTYSDRLARLEERQAQALERIVELRADLRSLLEKLFGGQIQ